MAKPITANKLSKIELSGDIASAFSATNINEVEGLLVKEALGLCDMDWETSIRGVCVADKMRTKIKGYYATYRSDNDHPLGVIRGRYTPLNNYDAFAWMDKIISDPDTDIKLAFGGVWEDAFGGQKTFLALNLGIHVLPIRDEEGNHLPDVLDKYVVMVNSHDGSSNLTLHSFIYRRLTQSVLNIHRPQDALKIRHAQGAKVKLKDVQADYETACQRLNVACEQFNNLAATKTDDSILWQAAIIGEMLGVGALFNNQQSPIIDPEIKRQPQWMNHFRVIEMICNIQPWEKLTGGTVWGVYTAACAYYDHVRIVRGTDKCAINPTMSKLFGHSASAKYQAFRACYNRYRVSLPRPA